MKKRRTEESPAGVLTTPQQDAVELKKLRDVNTRKAQGVDDEDCTDYGPEWAMRRADFQMATVLVWVDEQRLEVTRDREPRLVAQLERSVWTVER